MVEEKTGYEQLNDELISNIIFNKNLIAYYAQLVPKYPQAYKIVEGLKQESQECLNLVIKRKRGGSLKWEKQNGLEKRSVS